METHILWAPEGGVCGLCHHYHDKVRCFTSGGRHLAYCFPCWNGQQDGCLVSSKEWYDNIVLDFECIDNQVHGTAQAVGWN
jgi:hypothetical protein